MTAPSRSRTFPKRALVSSAVLGSCAAAGLGVAAPASLAAGTPSARALLLQTVKDAVAQRSVHTDATAVNGKAGALISDVALRSGIQTIRGTGGAVGHVRLIDRTDYLSGNRTGLMRDFGFSAAQAAALGERWVVLHYPSRAFVLTALDVNLPTTLLTNVPVGSLSVGPATTVDGRSVIPIRGSASKLDAAHGTLTLYVSTGARPLPVAAILASGRQSSRVSFSRWGERVSVHAPRSVVTPAQIR